MAPRKYRVSGSLPVLETPPGSVFEADLSADQEARWIASGSVELVKVTTNITDGQKADKEK